MEPRMDRHYVALDLETTGLSPAMDRIVEVGAVRFDAWGRELDRFQSLVDPGRPMPQAAWRIHGISDADLLGQPRAAAVLRQFFDWIGLAGPVTLLAHNARFDASFLGAELMRVGSAPVDHVVQDTLALARCRLPHARSHRLDALAESLGLDASGSHRALGDSLRVKALWLALEGDRHAPVCYTMRDGAGSRAVPVGWERMEVAISGGLRVRMEYQGGTRGSAPREVSPRRFVHKGGQAYVVAFCHIDTLEKAFRLDRVRSYEIVRQDARAGVASASPTEQDVAWPACS